jgi:putative sigma-54 modulation protein
MEIIVRGKNMDVNPAVKQYAEKKLSKIDRYLRQSPVSCQAVFSTVRGNYVLEVTVPLNGYLLRAEETSHDAVSAVDVVMDKLERQIEKYRTRIFRRDKGDIPNESLRKETEEGGHITKIKKFPMKPMSAEEATMQMELLGHDFFVFRNSETETVNVVYRRRDGDYGLIEPEN